MNNLSRMIGIQGVYTESIYKSCTKKVVTCQNPEQVISEITAATQLARSGRSGPCIVDIPIDLQAAKLDEKVIAKLINAENKDIEYCYGNLTGEQIKELIEAIQKSRAPLLWLGNGLREIPREKLKSIVEDLGIPYLTSWTAADLIDPIEHLDAGHAGTYGGRSGNLILQSCDLLITLGTRLAIPQRGYVDVELARRAKIFVVDCDLNELNKLSSRFNNKYCCDAPSVLYQIHEYLSGSNKLNIQPWLDHVCKAKNSLPLLENCHLNNQWINSYQFIAKLGKAVSSNTSFITDMGTALISGFQILRPQRGQRLFTSQGLGEMGYGLPGAIGAWYADPTRNIICLNCDGGLMMNLQDLHSVISHGIPMKIVILIMMDT